MIRMASIVFCAVFAWSTPAPASAQSAGDPASAPSGDITASADKDVAVTTCAGYYLALTSANPGPNPSARRRAQAKAAQDELFKVMLWVHGYTTGRAGPAARPKPLDSEWMRTHAEKLRVICAEDTRATMHLAEAVKQL